ncbi:MAG: site-specific DNA-methyltransferase, partial [Leptospiraceae bacterium]|nr:site-specific DNA-methyltransferase [Leptospiraceae bacterium]
MAATAARSEARVLKSAANKARTKGSEPGLSGGASKPSAVLPTIVGELWTSRQRQMHPIHYTVSYRASFKPELPDFFIQKFVNRKNAMILDPFGGRGTTAIQSNLNGFGAVHNDLSPIAGFLGRARRRIPELAELKARLETLELDSRKSSIGAEEFRRLEPFFH